MSINLIPFLSHKGKALSYIKNTFYALLFSSNIIVSMDQPSDWQLYKTFPRESTINSAYFDNNQKIFNEELLVTCAPKATVQAHMFGITSGNKLFGWSPKDDIKTFCLDSTGYLLMWSYGTDLTAFLPYFINTKGPQAIGAFQSSLPIAPNHLSFHKSDITAGTVARVVGKLLYIYDMNTNKDICSFEHEKDIKDCCFHPFKENIIASITGPKTWIRIIDVAAKKEILTLPLFQTYSSSIRFDETGNRLALAYRETITVLDISNLNHPQTIFSVQNTLNGKQACLYDKYLAVAFPECITLFNVTTKQEIATFAGNNDLSPMNCFDPTGNFMVILNDNNALIYKKTTTLNVTKAETHSTDSCCWPALCAEELKKSLASIIVFFQNQLS